MHLGILVLKVVRVEVVVGQGRRETSDLAHFSDDVMQEAEGWLLQQGFCEFGLRDPVKVRSAGGVQVPGSRNHSSIR